MYGISMNLCQQVLRGSIDKAAYLGVGLDQKFLVRFVFIEEGRMNPHFIYRRGNCEVYAKFDYIVSDYFHQYFVFNVQHFVY